MTFVKIAFIFWFSVDAWAEHLKVMSKVRSSKSNDVNRRTIRLLARKLVRKIFHFDWSSCNLLKALTISSSFVSLSASLAEKVSSNSFNRSTRLSHPA